ncbi:MAG: glycerophosphodiester phosphodiesterase [Alphaproteobacteria bacterium]|nr:glycerophosphodiester phosphodiesterase [Alphaproteobacteria bacterium]
MRLLPLALLAACAHSPRPTDHLFPAPVTVVGHRGGASLAPENTMAAFEQALALGVAIELDVRRCASGELVISHDDHLLRTAGVDGFIEQMTLDELRALDVGAWFGPEFAGERIPTLDEVFDRVDGQVVIDVEVKSQKGTDNAALARDVAATIAQHGLTDRVIVTSFSPFLLAELRAANPDIARGQLTGTFATSDLRGYEKVLLRKLAFNRKADADVLAIEDALATGRYVRRMQRKGYRVLVWTVDDPGDMSELIRRGVDGLITDDPDRALELL